MWYFFASLTAIGRILARLGGSAAVHPRDDVRRVTDFAFDDAPRVAHTTRDPFDQVLRPRVHDDQRIALVDAGADGRFDHESRRRVDPVLLADAAHADLRRAQPDLQRVDRFDEPASVRIDRDLDRGRRQSLLEPPALRGQHALEL